MPRRIRVAFVIGEYSPEERKRRENAALAHEGTGAPIRSCRHAGCD
jgi:hypothetical protein